MCNANCKTDRLPRRRRLRFVRFQRDIPFQRIESVGIVANPGAGKGEVVPGCGVVGVFLRQRLEGFHGVGKSACGGAGDRSFPGS